MVAVLRMWAVPQGGGLLATTRPLAPRMTGRLVESVMTTLDAQNVVVPGTRRSRDRPAPPGPIPAIGS
ncbi:hypothetical protein [Actinomadura luteofluorescens]